MESGALRIGEVAARASVNVQTLRFYERRGLVSEPPRRSSGYRQYPLESVQRVRFIRRAQGLGFTLAEIKELLRLRDDPHVPCKEVRSTAEAKMADIEQRIRRLRAMKSALRTLVASCVDNRGHDCPLLEALDEPPGRAGNGVG
jgi:MerR family transcriptional regulator, copper efflux regulator